MRKKQFQFVVFLFSLMLVFAASSALAAGGAKPPAAGPNTLTVANFGEPPSICPVSHNSQIGEMYNMALYNSLFYINSDLQPVPDLCESYENVSDTEWIFKLRRGVKFHNGSEMHAEDVVASLLRAKASVRVARFAQKFATIEALDEYTVKIVTAGPYSDTLFDLSHTGNSICPKALIDAKHDFNKQPVGTGPFKYKSWVLGDRLTMERFDGYFDPARAAKVQEIIFRLIPEGSSRTIALEVGEIDVIHQVETMDIAKLKKTPGIEVVSRETISFIGLNLNTQKPPLDNVLLRKALNAAVDRAPIIMVSTNGFGDATFAQVPMNMPGSSDVDAVPYNVELAKKYLAESGVDPASFKITMVTSEEHRARSCQVIQAAWAEIGIQSEIEMMEVATLLTRSHHGEFQATLTGYSNRSLLAWIKSTFGAASIGATNGSRTNDPAIEAQIIKCEQTLDPAQRLIELKELSRLCNVISTRIPLYTEIMTKAYNSNIESVHMEPNGQVYYSQVGWKK